MMIEYNIVSIPETVRQHVQNNLTDPIYGHEVKVSVAGEGDYGPCRVCLNTFKVGESRILFLYNPFSVKQEADFAGPIYIHTERCQAYGSSLSGPSSQTFPEAIRSLPITLRGYDIQNHFVAEEHPRSLNVEAAIEVLLRRAEVAFVHVRNSEAKCFMLRIERSSEKRKRLEPEVPGLERRKGREE